MYLHKFVVLTTSMFCVQKPIFLAETFYTECAFLEMLNVHLHTKVLLLLNTEELEFKDLSIKHQLSVKPVLAAITSSGYCKKKKILSGIWIRKWMCIIMDTVWFTFSSEMNFFSGYFTIKKKSILNSQKHMAWAKECGLTTKYSM